MLNIPQNITEAIDIIKHSFTDEELYRIQNLTEDNFHLFCSEIEDIINKEWGDEIYHKFINGIEFKSKIDIVMHISVELHKRINFLAYCIGKNMSSIKFSSTKKDTVDLKLINACEKWIIISFDDYRWLSKDTPQCGTHIIGYVINDHTNGLKALMHYWAIVINNKIEITRNIFEQDKVTWFLIAKTIKKTYFDVIDRENLDYLNLQIIPEIQQHYSDFKLKSIRNVPYLDPLRNPDYPDDVIISLKYADFKNLKIPLDVEDLWGRLEEKIDDNNFKCTILNNPKFFPKLKIGDTVRAKYIYDDDGPKLTIDLSPYFN